MNTSQVEALMRQRFAPKEWALLFNVSNSTGFASKGWADAVAMSLWPSRGLELWGFEFKVSRGDWKSELEKPAKAENVAQFCDRWYVVAPADVVKRDEVPKGWGWIEAKEDGLRDKLPAPLLQDAKPWPRAFIAAMLRRASEADAAVVDALVTAKLAPHLERAKVQAQQYRDARTNDGERALKKLEEIKSATGIDLADWTPSDEIASAIKVVLSGDLMSNYGGLVSVASDAKRLVAKMEELTSALGIGEKDGQRKLVLPKVGA